MSSQTTGFVPASQRVFGQLTLIEIIIGTVIILILGTFWTRFFKNLIYRTMCIDKYSTYQLFIVVLALTIIFIVILNLIQAFARDIVLGTPSPADVGTQGVVIIPRNPNAAELRAEACTTCDCESECNRERKIVRI